MCIRDRSGAAAWTGGGSDALLRAQAEQCKLVETRNAQAKLSSKSAAQLTAQQLRISSYRMQGHGAAGNRVPDVYAQSLPPSDECDASNAALVSAAGDDALREERQAILSLPGASLARSLLCPAAHTSVRGLLEPRQGPVWALSSRRCCTDASAPSRRAGF